MRAINHVHNSDGKQGKCVSQNFSDANTTDTRCCVHSGPPKSSTAVSWQRTNKWVDAGRYVDVEKNSPRMWETSKGNSGKMQGKATCGLCLLRRYPDTQELAVPGKKAPSRAWLRGQKWKTQGWDLRQELRSSYFLERGREAWDGSSAEWKQTLDDRREMGIQKEK